MNGDITIDITTKTIKINDINNEGITIEELYDYLRDEWIKEDYKFRFPIKVNLYKEIMKLIKVIR